MEMLVAKKDLEQEQKQRVCLWVLQMCKKELLNTMGGWIINGEKKHFCHDGRDGSCFDKYCHIKKEAQCQDTMEKR